MLIFALGFEKDKSLYRIDTIQLTIIYTVVFIIASYLFGLIVGFARTPYNLSLIGIVKNVVPFITLIILQELVRYEIISKSKGNKWLIVFITCLFILFDISLSYKTYDFSTLTGIYNVIGVSVIPIILDNLLLTFLCYRTGYKAPIIYRILSGLYVFIIPIIPNLGIYESSVVSVLLPLVVFIRVNSLMIKSDLSVLRRKRAKISIITILLVLISLFLFFLNTGILKYKTVVIVSESMEPRIKIGDIVVIDKLEDISNLKEGDIIAFNSEGKIIVHRIVKIYSYNEKIYIKTKGDNNNSEDPTAIQKKDVIGIAKVIIPKIGYPSVWLNDLWNK